MHFFRIWLNIDSVSSLFDSLRTQDDPEYFDRSPEEEYSARNTVNYSPVNASKRTRTFSPGAAKRDLETRRLEREKQKRERREKELNHRKQQRYQLFLSEIYSEVPNHAGPSNGAQRLLLTNLIDDVIEKTT